MKLVYGLLTGIGFGVALVACASFSYKYYAWDYENHMLLGHTAADDLADSICRGDSQAKTKCMVETVDEFFRMKSDFEKCESALKTCQARCH